MTITKGLLILKRLLSPRRAPRPATTRTEMDRALRDVVVPHLREQGFKGSYPYFRRRGAEAFDLLTFQFSRYGGAFVVEIARCSPDGIDAGLRGHIPAAKATAHDLPRRRRVGAAPGEDFWFRFEGERAEAIAEEVIACLTAEKWDELPVRSNVDLRLPPRNSE